MDFPAEGVYRGMSTPDTIIEPTTSTVGLAAFQFKPNQNRSDDSEECSVNWIDDENALVSVAAQVSVDRKTGESRKQFAIGACKISLEQLDCVKDKYPMCFSYERAPITEAANGNVPNPYHGNLLFVNPKQQGAKSLKRQVSSVLAYMADTFVPRVELDALLTA